MEAALMGNLPYAKGLWTVISGTTCRCEQKLVEEEIKKATPLLKEGLLYYKKFSDSSVQSISKHNPPARMCDLIFKLTHLLDLDAKITWDLVCNYTLYEYRNCAETFASQLTDIASMKTLIGDIWNFFYSERITVIKCLKLMVEYKDNKSHPNQKQFARFFQDILLGELLESIMTQIETIKFIDPPVRSQLCTDEHLHSLYNNSLIEMRELLHVLTVIINDTHISEDKFAKLFESIGGEPRKFINLRNQEDSITVQKHIKAIHYSQTALLLVAFDIRKHTGMDDWIRSIRDIMQNTFEYKCVRSNNEQDGPLLLSWMLANYAVELENIELMNRFKPFGIKAAQLNVFHYLHDLVKSEMIQEDTYYAEIVRCSIYNLLSLLCSLVDEERLSTFSGLFEVAAAILKFPETSAKFWEEPNNGLWLIYQSAVNMFPYNFIPLTVIATGLAGTSKSAKKIAAELDNLTSLTIEVPRKERRDQTSGYKPYYKECKIHPNTYTIPEICPQKVVKVVSAEREVVTFQTKASYWDALHHKMENLFLQAGGGITNISDMKTSIPECVHQGLKLLVALLSTDIEIPPNMVYATELSFEIVNRFSYPMLPANVYKIITECMNLASKLVLRYPEEIFTRMGSDVFPRFNNMNQKALDYAEASSFDGGLIASWLSGIETVVHSYPILSAYLDILSHYLLLKHSKQAMYTIEIPGMVFLLQGVLPKIDSWYFESDAERIDIWLKSMFCLHRALDSALPKHDIRNELQLVVAYSLLYLEPRHAILKLVRIGERTIHNQMISETDWISGKGFKAIKSVQLALSVVNRLLMFRKSLGLALDDRSPLEVALYSSPCVPNGLLIVPTIVNYLYVWCSPTLQAMAVRLLKKFAEGFSMSLLVCMGMDGTAIRETFASRLISPMCAAEVKVAILELVAVCLEKQPGLTEALFNIMHQAERNRIFPRPDGEFQTEGCNQFLDHYLLRIHTEKDIVEDKLYDSTMTLLRSMWYYRNEILVNYFRKREKFWTHLFGPLFRDLVPSAKGYSQLLDIITLELFKSPLLENDFSINLKKFLDKNSNHWRNFAKYVLTVNSSDNITSVQPLYETNLQSFYHFIVTLTDEKMSKKYHIDVSQAQLITELTLDSLLHFIKTPGQKDVGKIMMQLASLALRCITSWKQMCVGNSQSFKGRLTQLIQEIADIPYRGFSKSLRQTLLSLLLGCIQLIKSTLSDDPSSLEYLLAHSCTIATGELENLKEMALDTQRNEMLKAAEDQRKTEKTKATMQQVTEEHNARTFHGMMDSVPATLAVSMVSQLLRSYVERNYTMNNHRSAGGLQLRLMIPQLMSCISKILHRHSYFRFNCAALSLLGIIARSPYCPQPLEDHAIANIWLGLIPPREIGRSMVDMLYEDFTLGQWRCQDWWAIYTLGLEFILGLASKKSPLMYVGAIVIFLKSHEHHLMVVSTLLRHTADIVAADLIQSLIALISTVATKPIIWNAIELPLRETLIKCMYLAYDSTVNLLLRPRILKFIIDGISVGSAEELESCDEKLPSEELKLFVNKLIVINTTCALSFVHFSPCINTLVDTIYTQDFWYTPLAEMNFGPPQMCISSGPRLTYGTIISSTQLFTQALYSRSHPTRTSATAAQKGSEEVSAQREWERIAPESIRKMHTSKDLRKIVHATSSGTGGDFFSYVSGLDVTVPLLSSPRLVRRPYDPLICENSILSRATALTTGRHVKKTGGSSSESGQQVSVSSTYIDPWFASMHENNARLALEVNLMLILCQSLEGVNSPRLPLRDRQLIARETATELGVFFEFLEHRGTPDKWQVEGTLIGTDTRPRSVHINESSLEPILPARLKSGSTINHVPVCHPNHDVNSTYADISPEKRLDDVVLTTGNYDVNTGNVQFLPLMGKLLKSVVELLESTQF